MRQLGGTEARKGLAGGPVQSVTAAGIGGKFAPTLPDRLAGVAVAQFDRHHQHRTMITVDPMTGAPAIGVMAPVAIAVARVGLHQLLQPARLVDRKSVV